MFEMASSASLSCMVDSRVRNERCPLLIHLSKISSLLPRMVNQEKSIKIGKNYESVFLRAESSAEYIGLRKSET